MAESIKPGASSLTNNDFEIRIWRSVSDPPDEIIAIMAESHGTTIDKSWLAAKCSWGHGAVASIAYDGSRPIGIVLFGGAPYLINGRPAPIAVSFETYVSSKYRGRGVFMHLLKSAENACRDAGYAALLNFPNDSSRPGFIKAGWSSLGATRPYIHLVGGRCFVGKRAWSQSFAKNYKKGFVPSSVGPIDPASMRKFSALATERPGLTFDLSVRALEHRVSELRGRGYSIFLHAGTGAVVRVGLRGTIREVQILAFGPRTISPSATRRLVRHIVREHRPRLVSHIESATGRGVGTLLLSGFLPLNSRTTPFFKPLQEVLMPQDVVLSGIDIHTW